MAKTRVLIAVLVFFCGAISLLLAPLTASVPFLVLTSYLSSILLGFKSPLLHPAFALTFLYAFCYFLSLHISAAELAVYGYALEHGIVGQLVFGLGTVMLLLPALWMRPVARQQFYRSKTLDFAVTWGWLPALYAVIYLAPFAYRSLQAGASVVRVELLAAGGVLPNSPLTTMAVAISQFFAVYIVLWFYAGITARRPLVRVGLLLGVVAGLLWGVVFAARDMLIWIPLVFLFGYWYWRQLLSYRARRHFAVGLAVATVLLGVIFSLYTVQRFSESADGIWRTLLVYFGYQPHVFAELVSVHTDFYGLSLRFPVLADLLGITKDIVRHQPYEWQFGTILADFYSVSGWTSFVSLLGGFFIMFWWLFRRFSSNYQVRALHYLLYFMLVGQGVFYFRYGSVAGNVFIITLLFLGLVIALRRRPVALESAERCSE